MQLKIKEIMCFFTLILGFFISLTLIIVSIELNVYLGFGVNKIWEALFLSFFILTGSIMFYMSTRGIYFFLSEFEIKLKKTNQNANK